MATLVVKAHLSSPDGSVETRRFPLSAEAVSLPGLFKVVQKKIGSTFVALKDKEFSLMWKDSDGDFVLMSTDEEIQDAMNSVGKSSLQVYIQVDGDKAVKMTKLTEASNAPEAEKTLKENDSQREEDCEMEDQGFPFFSFPPGMMCPPPPPPPPPPPFPFQFAPHHWPGADSWKGRWNQGGPHMGGGMGFRGGPFGMPPHCSFGKRGGHPFGHWGHGKHGHHGHHHRHHHHHHNNDNTQADHSQGECKRGEGWKVELRSAVPLLHRRWAKMFIQKWRQENLANATTTTASEAGTDDELTIEKAGVPEAYRKWLERMLPRWHKKWGTDEVNSEESGDEEDKQDKKLLKMSVPKEFRKWIKWYLKRHFGRRAAPRFKNCEGEGNTCGQENMEQEGMCKGRKAGHVKKQILASLVPVAHRSFAKKYIHDWRVQKGLESLSATSATTSDSDDAGPSLDEEVEAVPQEYGNWLEVFLPRWHHWRGFIEKPKALEEKGGMGKFKDVVPMDFRAWVKFYLCRQYGRQRNFRCCDQQNEGAEMIQYRAWLKMFKEKWLEMNQMVGEDSEDFILLTSGDEGETSALVPSDDNTGAPEKSFKRLRLSDEEEGTSQKSVQFDPASYQKPVAYDKMQKKMMKKMMKSAIDSDDGVDDMEIRNARRKHPINHGFRKWVWQELDNWDGQSTPDSSTDAQKSSQAGEAGELPAHVSRWMFKVMKKVQKRKAKQEMKVAKREIKAAQKVAMAELKAAKRAANSQQRN